MNKFYVATAIPYVNAKPHLGHALLFTYGDVLARYYRLNDAEVFFSIGTDEHGGKVLEKATEMELDVKNFVDQNSKHFKDMATDLNISYSNFIRTTDTKHIQGVLNAWNSMSDYIYKGVYKGWYCQGCEDYKTATIVKETNGICPDHKTKYTLLKEENYFFKLSSFADRLRDLIEIDKIKIIPTAAKNEVLGFLKNELIDISISRPKENLKWGIEVPNDSSQVIYVWFDALLNYITVLGYPDGADFKTFWPSNVQIIGRDILRFHAVIWPAMLMALNLPALKTLYVHGLVTVEGQKMSKTLGNVVDPLDLVKNYGLDAFRYYFLRHLPAYENGDYSLDRFLASYNNELVDQLGNLIYRLQNLAWQKCQGKLPLSEAVKLDNHNLKKEYDDLIFTCRFDQALHLLFTEIKALNRFLEISQPWALSNNDQVKTILDQAVVNLIFLANLLMPFIPNTSQIIFNTFESNQVTPIASPPLKKIS